ncbi:MAG: FkbM family methyltransferase [Saprospiraceae bacterium]
MSLKQKVRRLRWRLFGNPKLKDKRYPAYWFQKILGDKEVQIVQIGSNDGRSGDPIYHLLQKRTNWHGLFVEPISYIFENLKKNYPDSTRFRFENSAINKGESLEFHWVDPIAKKHLPDLPFYYDQLGSFNKDHIVKALDGILAPYIISEKVNGITLDTLLKKHQIADFDILHIDVEGYDWEVLSQLNQEKNQPTFILYEAVHLSKSDLKQSADFLENNYCLFRFEGDILAANKKVGDKFLHGMERNLKVFDLKNYPSKTNK